MNSEERASAENGLWLCCNCGKLVDDDESTYTVLTLNEWKRAAEERAAQSLGSAASTAGTTISGVILKAGAASLAALALHAAAVQKQKSPSWHFREWQKQQADVRQLIRDIRQTPSSILRLSTSDEEAFVQNTSTRPVTVMGLEFAAKGYWHFAVVTEHQQEVVTHPACATTLTGGSMESVAFTVEPGQRTRLPIDIGRLTRDFVALRAAVAAGRVTTLPLPSQVAAIPCATGIIDISIQMETSPVAPVQVVRGAVLFRDFNPLRLQSVQGLAADEDSLRLLMFPLLEPGDFYPLD